MAADARGRTPEGAIRHEWVDAAMLESGLALMAGQGGFAVVDAATAEERAFVPGPRALRAAAADGLGVLGTRTDGLQLLDLRDPLVPTRGPRVGPPPGGEVHEDVAVDGGRVLSAWRAAGAALHAGDGGLLGVIPAEDAVAVALQGDRALVGDGDELGLWDLSDPAAPVRLDVAPLAAPARDLAWRGDHAAVGLGGQGVAVFAVEGDGLRARGSLAVPGSALSVAVDGDDLWIASWTTTALADLGADPPALRGHEAPYESAMGVAAGGGRAVVADWTAASALVAVPGARGPELVGPAPVFFDPALRGPRFVEVGNAGQLPLQVELDPLSDGYTASPMSWTVEPGGAVSVELRPPADGELRAAELRGRTNDADEPELRLRLGPADAGVGSAHADLRLPAVRAGTTSVETLSLADQRGKVVVIAYWALF